LAGLSAKLSCPLRLITRTGFPLSRE
jgi:hypothetical protein